MTQTQEALLRHGAEIIHLKGFHHTGINEILHAAGVPKGSFYFHFKSKEDFGLKLIDFYAQQLHAVIDKHLEAEGPYMTRFRLMFEEFRDIFTSQGCRLGCPIGNLALEMSDTHEAFRRRLEEVFRSLRRGIQAFLQGARSRGEITEVHDIEKTADFIINSWEGALLRAKVQKSPEPLDLFFRFVSDWMTRHRLDDRTT